MSAGLRNRQTGTGTRALADVDASITGSTDLSGEKKERIQHFKVEDSDEVDVHYTLGKKLGQGSFGTVHIIQHKATNKTYACKIVKKKRGSPVLYEQLQREIAIMKRVNHPHIVQLYEVYETPRKYFLVMEYCRGGDLVQRIRSRRGCCEADVRVILCRLVSAIAYLHDHGVVHRDLKPENILVSLSDPSDQFNIKVSDFGLATFADACNMMENIVGTPLYMAPEIVQNLGYSATCDVWSIGVMMYLMLMGYRRDIERELQQLIAMGKVEFPEGWWKDVSVGARALCEQTLKIDPAKRITAREMLMHPWMRGTDTSDTSTNPPASTVLDLMRSYNAERRLRVTLLTVQAAIRFRSFSLPRFSSSSSLPPRLSTSTSKTRSIAAEDSASDSGSTDSLMLNSDDTEVWDRKRNGSGREPRARSAASVRGGRMESVEGLRGGSSGSTTDSSLSRSKSTKSKSSSIESGIKSLDRRVGSSGRTVSAESSTVISPTTASTPPSWIPTKLKRGYTVSSSSSSNSGSTTLPSVNRVGIARRQSAGDATGLLSRAGSSGGGGIYNGGGGVGFVRGKSPAGSGKGVIGRAELPSLKGRKRREGT
ncbi:Serine/threonine-protein kinase 33 [Rhizophlyctis rosea]|nr:Serine/threonine-protein kinase 33 [Rhizophlyctis rosea]